MYSIQEIVICRTAPQLLLKLTNRIFLREMQAEFFLKLLVNIPLLHIRNVGLAHERHKVQNEIGTLSEDGECDEAKLLEAGELR